MADAVERAIREAHGLADSIYDALSRKMYIGNLHAAIDRLVALVRLEQAEKMIEIGHNDCIHMRHERDRLGAEAALLAGKEGAR